MKKFLSTFAAGTLVFSLTLTSASAALAPIRSFSDSVFFDIPDDWSYPYILSCYELGLMMSGQEEGYFSPSGTVSVAEAITVASRVHNLWHGGNGIFAPSTPWYGSVVEYGTASGLLTQDQFTDFSAPATRAQLADLLAKALPMEDLSSINEISSLPDVTEETPCADSILTLYRSGVLTGSDPYGTFSPDTSITRAELAAILCRLVRPEMRQHLSLLEPNQTDGPAAEEPLPIPTLDSTSFNEALSEGSLMAVLFSADWCQPCQFLAPTIGLLAAQYQDQALVARVDVDQEPLLTQQYNVTNYPTVIFFHGGQEVDRQIGAQTPETYTAILNDRL